MPILVSIQVGLPKSFGKADSTDFFQRPWSTGIFKDKVNNPVWVGKENISGDGQADLKHHGGPEKSVLAYAVENYGFLQDILDYPALGLGALGENLSILGQTELSVCIGDVYEIGSAQLQVSQPRQPCWKLARRWGKRDLALKIQESGKTGWYLRTLKEGLIEPHLSVQLLDRPYPKFTVQYLNQIMHFEHQDRDRAAELAECPALSNNWRSSFYKRAQTGINPKQEFRLWGD